MDSIKQRLDASFTALSTQIVQSGCDTREAVLATLRGEMGTQGEDLRGEMRSMGAELRAEMRSMGAELRFAIAEGDAETRRFMLILHEEVLSRIALLGEGYARSS